MDCLSSFCKCEFGIGDVNCHCGEEFESCEWNWDESPSNSKVRLRHNQRQALFNPVYSVGTAAVRGSTPFAPGRQYLWEIKMLSFVHGTDMVVGVGTAQVNLTAYSNNFIALLGNDSESWGYSYKGDIIHAGERTPYGPQFGRGSIVGVHLDMWTGTLEFYLNKQPLGVAFRIRKNQVLFPMVCSTMGHCAIRLTSAMSWPASLELSCLQSISSMPQLCEIPGLQATWGKTFWWQQATELKKEVEELVPSEAVECELEIISSDEEEREKIVLQSRNMPRTRTKWRQRFLF